MSETDKRTATQKIEDLERVVSMLFNNAQQTQNALQPLLTAQREIAILKDTIHLLMKKTEAIIQVANASSGITLEAIKESVLKMSVEELKRQVIGYLSAGNLEATAEDAVVTKNSFIVGEELNTEDGKIVNPRIQFPLNSQSEATIATFEGKKVGDVVTGDDKAYSLKILELYSIVQPKAPEAVATEATAPAAETAAVEVSTSTETSAATETSEEQNQAESSEPVTAMAANS